MVGGWLVMVVVVVVVVAGGGGRKVGLAEWRFSTIWRVCVVECMGWIRDRDKAFVGDVSWWGGWNGLGGWSAYVVVVWRKPPRFCTGESGIADGWRGTVKT